MGLFTGLLTLPIAPVRGVVWVAEKVADEADRQLYDEDQIRGELLQLEIDAEDGNLDEEERQRMEDELFQRLAVAQARARQQEFGPPREPEPGPPREQELTPQNEPELAQREDSPETNLREGNTDG